MNSFVKAARHVLRSRLVKQAAPYSDKAVEALEHLAETGQLPDVFVQDLVNKYQDSTSNAMWRNIKRRALQGLGVGAGLGSAGGAISGVANGKDWSGIAGDTIGNGLWNAGLGSLIGGGLGAVESYFTTDKEKAQAKRILSKLQEAAEQQPIEEPVPQELSPEMLNLPPMPVFTGGGMPTINYNIHNFGPQLLQR